MVVALLERLHLVRRFSGGMAALVPENREGETDCDHRKEALASLHVVLPRRWHCARFHFPRYATCGVVDKERPF